MEERRRFTAEFKHEAIRLLKTSGKPSAVVAGDAGFQKRSELRQRIQKRCQGQFSTEGWRRRIDALVGDARMLGAA